MKLNEYFGDWLKVIDINELNKIVKSLNTLYRVKKICPNQIDVFKAFTLCSLHDLKVVFLGQDPYPQKDVATGILFGNRKDTELSPSLNIVKEAAINFEIPHKNIIFDPTLESWAKQGILMLNSALTVEMNKVGSHIMLWRPFISKLIQNISKYDTGIVYVLFGNQAQTFIPYIGNNNHIIKIEHPAYYARTHTKMSYNLFDNINTIVKGIYGSPIEWYSEY